MIDFHYAPTPNGWKVAIMLEECALPWRLRLMNLARGDQFSAAFLEISPNAKMPAILDHDETPPMPVFESGAILWHLAEKTGRFLPLGRLARKEAMEWMFWQAANQGPLAGQLSHFRNYAPEGQDYARARYAGEYERNLAVLDARLARGEWMVGDAYSIVDMMCFPWAFIARPLGADLADFPHVAAWRARIKERPAVRRAIDLAKDAQNRGRENATNNTLLYNQTAAHLRDALAAAAREEGEQSEEAREKKGEDGMG